MGGSTPRPCVCVNYFCDCAFAYWTCWEGGQRGHLYKGLEVTFWFQCVSVCLCMSVRLCTCLGVVLLFLPYKAVCSLYWRAFRPFGYGVAGQGATMATTGCVALIAEGRVWPRCPSGSMCRFLWQQAQSHHSPNADVMIHRIKDEENKKKKNETWVQILITLVKTSPEISFGAGSFYREEMSLYHYTVMGCWIYHYSVWKAPGLYSTRKIKVLIKVREVRVGLVILLSIMKTPHISLVPHWKPTSKSALSWFSRVLSLHLNTTCYSCLYKVKCLPLFTLPLNLTNLKLEKCWNPDCIRGEKRVEYLQVVKWHFF